MDYFSISQERLCPDFDIDPAEKGKIDSFLRFLDTTGLGRIIGKNVKTRTSAGGRLPFNPYRFLAAVLYAFCLKRTTLREIDSLFKNDLRFLYIMEGEKPGFSTISNFMNAFVLPCRDEIFHCITSAVLSISGADAGTAFLDGTKLEANANKYKFVWKPTWFHGRLDRKTVALLSEFGIDAGRPGGKPLTSEEIGEYVRQAEKILARRGIDMADEAGKKGKARSASYRMYLSLCSYLEKTLEYEEKERICGPDRNSYYKTDHDATAMCLKEDYYSGAGGNRHAAYQVQLIVCGGIIAEYLIDQNRNDAYSAVPILRKYRSFYGRSPERLVADAGYGLPGLYGYCRENGIEPYVKYQDWQGEVSGTRPPVYEAVSPDRIRCLGGRTGRPVPGQARTAGGRILFAITGCTGCAFMPYCRRFRKDKDSDSRTFQVDVGYRMMRQKARDLLLSRKGIELRVNRSCQVEGAFGVIKQDMGLTRFRRRSLEKVSMEFMLYALGYNIGKLRKALSGKLKVHYWTAPPGLVPEQIRKPSAKRLNKRAQKVRKKSVNERARENK